MKRNKKDYILKVLERMSNKMLAKSNKITKKYAE